MLLWESNQGSLVEHLTNKSNTFSSQPSERRHKPIVSQPKAKVSIELVLGKVINGLLNKPFVANVPSPVWAFRTVVNGPVAIDYWPTYGSSNKKVGCVDSSKVKISLKYPRD